MVMKINALFACTSVACCMNAHDDSVYKFNAYARTPGLNAHAQHTGNTRAYSLVRIESWLKLCGGVVQILALVHFLCRTA